jgi:hypothetical protein
MKPLINWPDWMKDGTVIAKDKSGELYIYEPCAALMCGSSWWLFDDDEESENTSTLSIKELQNMFHLPENFITTEYLELDWKESKIIKGEEC